MRSALPGPLARAMASICRMRDARAVAGSWPATASELRQGVASGRVPALRGEKPSARLESLRRKRTLTLARLWREGQR